MHINKEISRTKQPYLKMFLRVAWREGGKLKRRTIANLTYWDRKTVAQLEDALYLKRYFAGTPIETDAVSRIYTLLTENVEWADDSMPFQILTALTK